MVAAVAVGHAGPGVCGLGAADPGACDPARATWARAAWGRATWRVRPGAGRLYPAVRPGSHGI